MRVLVIEDEPKTGAYLKKGVQESGCQVDVAADGVDGLFLAQEYPYDVIVLDVTLPAMDGWSVLKALRASHATPVLFLSARRLKAQGRRGAGPTIHIEASRQGVAGRRGAGSARRRVMDAVWRGGLTGR